MTMDALVAMVLRGMSDDKEIVEALRNVASQHVRGVVDNLDNRQLSELIAADQTIARAILNRAELQLVSHQYIKQLIEYKALPRVLDAICFGLNPISKIRGE